MSISSNLLPEFDAEMANTRKILACVPEGKMDYKPHPKSMGLGYLATHIAELPSWASTTLTSEVLEGENWKPAVAETQAQLLSIFDKSVAEARKNIEATPDEAWGKTWTFKWQGKEMFSMPRVAVVRSVVMNHLIHHRAQLGVYLRLNDIAIPGMYGPSADEAQFWQTSTAS